MDKEFNKNKLKSSIEQLKQKEYWGPDYPERPSQFCYQYVDTVTDILEILHRDDITVAYAREILQDTYKIMCLGATF